MPVEIDHERDSPLGHFCCIMGSWEFAGMMYRIPKLVRVLCAPNKVQLVVAWESSTLATRNLKEPLYNPVSNER